VEDIHHILRLPIQGANIVLLQTREEAHPLVSELFKEDVVEELMVHI